MNSGLIKITLKSDLCIGSGYSFAGVVDSDVIYNKNGLPYIPSKRLKGCMREAANLIGINKKGILDIFGTPGNEKSDEFEGEKTDGIIIDNAYINNYEALNIILTKAINKKEISAEEVLDQFTTVRGQTKLEKGVAVDNSLRYTRVVNHYSPLNDEELTFFAYIEYENTVKKEDLEKIIKCVRNIGMDRNRGLGSVKCELCVENAEAKNSSDCTPSCNETDGNYVINFVIKNASSIVMSSDGNGDTDTYISGKSLLGLLAGRYLKENPKNADTNEFISLFLNSSTKYTNIYPCTKINNKYYRSIPAPLIVNKLKKTKKYVNALSSYNLYKGKDTDYNPDNGNQNKKLKTQYLAGYDGESFKDEIETELDITFHHRKPDNNADNQKEKDGMLYSLETIEEGQLFAGMIITDSKEHANKIIELLKKAPLRFGKSKSSQYGKCELETVKEVPITIEKKIIRSGEEVAVILISDGIFLSEQGYTVLREDVRNAIKEKLSLKDASEEYDASDVFLAKEITGYNAVWNLKKASLPAVKAGSCFIFTTNTDVNNNHVFIGERNMEGYGEAIIVPIDRTQWTIEGPKIYNTNLDADNSEEENHSLIYAIKDRREFAKLFIDNKDKTDKSLDGAALGRITLMVKESTDENNFKARIESIKSNTLKSKAENISDTLEKCITDSKLNDKTWKVKQRFLITMLTYIKYQKGDR